jgi:hypothetical protein
LPAGAEHTEQASVSTDRPSHHGLLALDWAEKRAIEAQEREIEEQEEIVVMLRDLADRIEHVERLLLTTGPRPPR